MFYLETCRQTVRQAEKSEKEEEKCRLVQTNTVDWRKNILRDFIPFCIMKYERKILVKSAYIRQFHCCWKMLARTPCQNSLSYAYCTWWKQRKKPFQNIANAEIASVTVFWIWNVSTLAFGGRWAHGIWSLIYARFNGPDKMTLMPKITLSPHLHDVKRHWQLSWVFVTRNPLCMLHFSFQHGFLFDTC